ncbi:MAG TPA: K(+)-transporting ATPase subunit C [Luteolibacter sp.]
MKAFLSELRGAVVATLVLAGICCGLYPLAVTGISRLTFKAKADGGLITDQGGKVVGSALIGQNFTGEKYFHPRPSSAGGNGYDALVSGGSNLGPTSQKLADQIRSRVAEYRTNNGLGDNQLVPADAVTASASGLDPHISPANAGLQIARVARARNLSAGKVRELVAANTDRKDLGLLGDPGVNVLKLNLALDQLKE